MSAVNHGNEQRINTKTVTNNKKNQTAIRKHSATDVKDIDYALDDHGFRAPARRGRHQARATDLTERSFAHKLGDFILSRHVPLDRAATFPANPVPARVLPSRARKKQHRAALVDFCCDRVAHFPCALSMTVTPAIQVFNNCYCATRVAIKK
jgi:hypothetical protein